MHAAAMRWLRAQVGIMKLDFKNQVGLGRARGGFRGGGRWGCACMPRVLAPCCAEYWPWLASGSRPRCENEEGGGGRREDGEREGETVGRRERERGGRLQMDTPSLSDARRIFLARRFHPTTCTPHVSPRHAEPRSPRVHWSLKKERTKKELSVEHCHQRNTLT